MLTVIIKEQQSAGRSRLASQGEAGEAGGASGGSYYLDEMSDEEMETEGQRGPRPSGGITPSQLAQALAMAAGMGGGGGSGGGGNFSPFQGVTGLGVGSGQRREEGRSQSQASTPSTRITTNMFQQAMQQALMSSVAGQGGQGSQGGQGGQPQPESQQTSDSDLASKVDRMREMGIVDEGLAIQALQIMGGDLQAAVDLIFSGWEGGDEAMS